MLMGQQNIIGNNTELLTAIGLMFLKKNGVEDFLIKT